MGYTVGCTYTNNCVCDPCCCNTNPNCDQTKGDDLKFYEDTTCCYGPWDTYVRTDGVWKLNHTIFCLTDVYQYYNDGPGKDFDQYTVELAGNHIDCDMVEDPDTPECWFEIDPFDRS